MKNIDKSINKQVERAGGKTMRTFAVSDPRFSRVISGSMFNKKEKINDDIEKAKKNEKPTYNPNKNIKPLKKMKGAHKGQGTKY